MYRHDDSVNLIIRQSNNNELLNQEEKAKFNTIIKKTATGLLKNNKSNSKMCQTATYEVLDYLAKTLDGRSFTLLVKYVQELRNDVLLNETHKLTTDSFLIFIDKLRNLTSSQNYNDIIIAKFEEVDISLITVKRMLAQRKKLYSKKEETEEDSKHNLVGELYESRIRMDEIQQFAANVVPKPRFIFDSYKVSTKPNWDDSFSESEQEYPN